MCSIHPFVLTDAWRDSSIRPDATLATTSFPCACHGWHKNALYVAVCHSSGLNKRCSQGSWTHKHRPVNNTNIMLLELSQRYILCKPDSLEIRGGISVKRSWCVSRGAFKVKYPIIGAKSTAERKSANVLLCWLKYVLGKFGN